MAKPQPSMNPIELKPEDEGKDTPPPPKPSQLERARALQRQKRDALSLIEVEMQVRDGEHARSEEVISFCIKQLQQGTTWDELRFKLGVGPASSDRRWRAIRQTVIGKMAPENESDALEDSYSKRAILLERLENFLEDVESKLLTDPAGDGTTHHYFKMRLDAMKTLLEENNNEFQSYLELRKVKAQEKGNRGVSILVQNNFALARPSISGKDEKKLIEQVVEVIEVVQAADLVERK